MQLRVILSWGLHSTPPTPPPRLPPSLLGFLSLWITAQKVVFQLCALLSQSVFLLPSHDVGGLWWSEKFLSSAGTKWPVWTRRHIQSVSRLPYIFILVSGFFVSPLCLCLCSNSAPLPDKHTVMMPFYTRRVLMCVPCVWIPLLLSPPLTHACTLTCGLDVATEVLPSRAVEGHAFHLVTSGYAVLHSA